MIKKIITTVGVLLGILLIVGIGSGMPNPASVYCEELGGRLEIVTEEVNVEVINDDSGNNMEIEKAPPEEIIVGSYGMCHFPNGDVCEEWALFKGECDGYPAWEGGQPTADEPVTPEAPVPDIQVPDEVLDRVIEFVKTTPEYTSGGIENSLEVYPIHAMRCPGCWEFAASFEKANKVYEEGSDLHATEIIEIHQMVVRTDNGKVIGAEKVDLIEEPVIGIAPPGALPVDTAPEEKGLIRAEEKEFSTTEDVLSAIVDLDLFDLESLNAFFHILLNWRP